MTIARGRIRPTSMNKTERAYGAHLALRDDVLWFAFEAVKLRLADKTYYTPDFVVMLTDGAIEIHEVKGFWEDDARVKIKVAAERFPFRFVAVKAISQKDGDGWSTEIFERAARTAKPGKQRAPAPAYPKPKRSTLPKGPIAVKELDKPVVREPMGEINGVPVPRSQILADLKSKGYR